MSGKASAIANGFLRDTFGDPSELVMIMENIKQKNKF